MLFSCSQTNPTLVVRGESGRECWAIMPRGMPDSPSPTTRPCPWSCVSRELASQSEISDVINATRTRGGALPTLVDPTRIRATIALSIAALKVPGDYIETGVYRGGTSVLMMHVLDRAGDTTRRFWACDSFEGLPAASSSLDDPLQPPAASCMQQNKSACLNAISRRLTKRGELRSSLGTFRSTLSRFRVSTDRLRVVKGWFSDTLPPPGLKRIAFLRLDGDLYNSTWEGLIHLEPLVVPGGYIYVDDYGAFRGCGAAVDRYISLLAPGLRSQLVLNTLPNRHGRVQALWWRKAVLGSV